MAKGNFSDVLSQSLQGRTVEKPVKKEIITQETEKEVKNTKNEEILIENTNPEVNEPLEAPSKAPNSPKQPSKPSKANKSSLEENKEQNKAIFNFKKKDTSKKKTYGFYLKESNYAKLEKLANEYNKGVSEILDEILDQIDKLLK